MSYVLRERVHNRYYCKDHNKIIEFNNTQDAHNFLASFGQYVMIMAMQYAMSDPSILGDVQQVLNSTTVDEKPNCDCEFVKYEDLKK